MTVVKVEKLTKKLTKKKKKKIICEYFFRKKLKVIHSFLYIVDDVKYLFDYSNLEFRRNHAKSLQIKVYFMSFIPII